MSKQSVIQLPQPKLKGSLSVEEALSRRRTIRILSEKEISLDVTSQLLWALYGVNNEEKVNEKHEFLHRTVPSAGHIFPLVVYIVTEQGAYRYDSIEHSLHLVHEGDLRVQLGNEKLVELNRDAIRKAPITILLAVDNEKALRTSPLMESALKYSYLEAGHAAQNLILQATSIGLGTTTITSFDISIVYRTMKIPLNHRPIYILPVGHPMMAE